MSPIIDLQRGISEAGRIRIGQQVAAGNGRTRPAKLDTFRLTSADRRRIDQAAELYGGTVAEWAAPAGKQWQVITTADSLDVIVPPSDLSFSQNYELWSAGGCQRRCDGVTEQIGEQPCVCDPAARECDIHTRLSVMLRDLPGLGVWRIDTQGWYAAREMSGAVRIIQMAAGRGALLPARLRLEQRSVKRPDEHGKVQTLRYAVPVIDIEITPAQLLAGSSEPLELEQVTRPPLTPVPQLTSLLPSIAEQSAAPAARPPRKNAAPAIPASGRQRSQAAPAAAIEKPESQPAQAVGETAAEGEGAASSPAVDLDKAHTGDELTRWLSGTHAAMRERVPEGNDEHAALRQLAATALASMEPAHLLADRSLNDLTAREWRHVAMALRDTPVIPKAAEGTGTPPAAEEAAAADTAVAPAQPVPETFADSPPAKPAPADPTAVENAVYKVSVEHGLIEENMEAGPAWAVLDTKATKVLGVVPSLSEEPGPAEIATYVGYWTEFAAMVAAGTFDKAARPRRPRAAAKAGA
jgi:hypothetical protein